MIVSLATFCNICFGGTVTFFDKYTPPTGEIVVSSFSGGVGAEWKPMWDNDGTIADRTLSSSTHTLIKATCSNGQRVSLEKRIAATDYSLYDNIQLNFYIDSAQNISGNIGLMLQFNGNWANNQHISFPPCNGWNYLKCNKCEPTSSQSFGTVDFTHVTAFALTVDAQAGKNAAVTFEGLKLSKNSLKKAVVIITADDSWKSFYKYGFSKMVANGLKGTIFQATSLIVTDTNDTNFVTLSHLKAYQNAGFDVANHTHNHYNFDSVSFSTALADIALGEQYLRNDGFKASRLLAWPSGHFNDSLIAAVKPYADFARSVNRFWFEYPPFSNPYAIRCRCFDNSTTLQSAKECIDSVIKYKGVFVNVFHKLSPGKQDDITWDTASFNQYINYLKTKVNVGLVEVMPFSQFLGENNIAVKRTTSYTNSALFHITQSGCSYNLPVASTVIIKLYNLQGKIVQTMCTINQQAGTYKISFGTLKLAQGTYLLNFKAGTYSARGKIVLK
jgi:peptidoglycan/xylan/chitin deacetylase (PgdA/CDA1 family)